MTNLHDPTSLVAEGHDCCGGCGRDLPSEELNWEGVCRPCLFADLPAWAKEDIERLRAEIEWLKAQQRWRSVTDEPPCDLEELIIASDGLVTKGCRSESGTWLSEALTLADEVTHWMPFPDPPAD